MFQLQKTATWKCSNAGFTDGKVLGETPVLANKLQWLHSRHVDSMDFGYSECWPYWMHICQKKMKQNWWASGIWWTNPLNLPFKDFQEKVGGTQKSDVSPRRSKLFWPPFQTLFGVFCQKQPLDCKHSLESGCLGPWDPSTAFLFQFLPFVEDCWTLRQKPHPCRGAPLVFPEQRTWKKHQQGGC